MHRSVPPARHRPDRPGGSRFPSRVFAINRARQRLALTGIDLFAWTRTLLLHGDLARAGPEKPRHRLLHVLARIARTARRTWLRIAQGRRWAHELSTTFARLQRLPESTPSPDNCPEDPGRQHEHR